MGGVFLEQVRDWRKWLSAKGVRPIHARRWTHADEKTSSGAFRCDDGRAWAWERRGGVVDVWLIDDDVSFGPALESPEMEEAYGEADCRRLMDAGDPWDAQAGVRAADARRDRMMRKLFG